MKIRDLTPAQLAKHRRTMKLVAIMGAITALTRLADSFVVQTHTPDRTAGQTSIVQPR
jgi:hypothetical protein